MRPQTCLGVIIGRCSLHSQHGKSTRHPANVGCSFSRNTNNSSFRHTSDEQIDHSHQKSLRRKWTREDNKLALYCYFRHNSAKWVIHTVITVHTVIHTVRIYNQNISMEFGREKCAMLVMKSGKRHITEGVELPNQVIIRTLGEKETYKYLGILETDNIKQQEMKENIFKKASQKNQKITRDKTLLQEPCQRDKYRGSSPRKILGTISEVDQRRT